MNILMLINAPPMNYLITLLLEFYTSSNYFLDMLHSLISSYPLLTSKYTSDITRPSANLFALQCQIHFTIIFRRIANIKIQSAISFPLHCTLTLNKNFKLNSVPSCMRSLYNQRCQIKPSALFQAILLASERMSLKRRIKEFKKSFSEDVLR